MATSTTDTETLSVEAMVCGYHVYQEIWHAALGEQLSCKREPGNRKDPFAVAVVRALVTVGHLPKKISSVCSMFLLRGGTIHCQVIAPRCHSGDLPQGGLEIPCMLTFEGDRKDVAKARRLVRYALFTSPEAATKDEPPKKKIKYDNSSNETKGIITGEKLSDLHINHAQKLLKQQFSCCNGLQCTLLQSKKYVGKPHQLQVIHCCSRNHWIVASTKGCKDDEVNVYNSVYSTLDDETNEVIANLFHSPTVLMIKTQKQEGSKDCGLFAIAVATAIAHGADPTSLRFDQAAMRNHLVQCFKDGVMTMFPVSH